MRLQLTHILSSLSVFLPNDQILLKPVKVININSYPMKTMTVITTKNVYYNLLNMKLKLLLIGTSITHFNKLIILVTLIVLHNVNSLSLLTYI